LNDLNLTFGGNGMFFSRLAWILAIAAFATGMLSVVLGTAVTMNLLDEANRARYVGRSPEQVIIGGLCVILASVALGTLAEMSLAVRRSTP
jgi:hypothetical protein